MHRRFTLLYLIYSMYSMYKSYEEFCHQHNDPSKFEPTPSAIALLCHFHSSDVKVIVIYTSRWDATRGGETSVLWCTPSSGGRISAEERCAREGYSIHSGWDHRKQQRAEMQEQISHGLDHNGSAILWWSSQYYVIAWKNENMGRDNSRQFQDIWPA